MVTTSIAVGVLSTLFEPEFEQVPMIGHRQVQEAAQGRLLDPILKSVVPKVFPKLFPKVFPKLFPKLFPKEFPIFRVAFSSANRSGNFWKHFRDNALRLRWVRVQCSRHHD